MFGLSDNPGLALVLMGVLIVVLLVILARNSSSPSPASKGPRVSKAKRKSQLRVQKQEDHWQQGFRNEMEDRLRDNPDQITITIEGATGDMVYAPVTTTSQRFEYAVAWFKEHSYRLENHTQGVGLHAWTAVFQREVSTRNTDIADQLSKLAVLRDEGVLTGKDWERAKDLFLGKGPDKKEEAVRMLRSIHELHRSGVLSEGEFNMKKWDILSRP